LQRRPRIAHRVCGPGLTALIEIEARLRWWTMASESTNRARVFYFRVTVRLTVSASLLTSITSFFNSFRVIC
jgi:hypothetical protein